MMRHCEGTQEKFEEVARLHEVVRIAIGNVCMRVVQLVGLTKVCEWDHAWEESDASPPEVCGLRATEMTMHTFMGHNRAEKYQIRSQQNVGDHQQRIRERNQKCADRE